MFPHVYGAELRRAWRQAQTIFAQRKLRKQQLHNLDLRETRLLRTYNGGSTAARSATARLTPSEQLQHAQAETRRLDQSIGTPRQLAQRKRRAGEAVQQAQSALDNQSLPPKPHGRSYWSINAQRSRALRLVPDDNPTTTPDTHIDWQDVLKHW